jgi:uncharacterized protein
MLMALGLFVFAMPTLPFQELEQRQSWRWGTSDRFGARPAAQYLGPGEDQVTITGCLYPLVAGDRGSLDTLRAMAAQGASWPLIDGTGRIFGDFAISEIDARGAAFIDNGVPRRTDFSIELHRVG